MPSIVEWNRTAWQPEHWRGIDQPPVFLDGLGSGDDVLSLEGDDPGFFGFISQLLGAMCASAGGATLNLDLRAAPSGDGHGDLADVLVAGDASKDADGRWVMSLDCGRRLADWFAALFDTHLDYQFAFSGVRLVERDGAIILIAGPASDVSNVQSLVERLAEDGGVELKPVGWDFDQC